MAEETIYVVRQHLYFLGAVTSEEAVYELVRDKGDINAAATVDRMPLYRPDLRPIYGGPTLLEALWSEMDRLMEGLMTGADAEDGGDKFRAAELAWALAIVSNPYNPSVDAIRAETMERWKGMQEMDEVNSRPPGADQ